MNFKHIAFLVATILTLAIFSACSGDGEGSGREFTIKARIQGMGAKNATLTYYANQGLQRSSVKADDKGSFVINGSSDNPTLAIISIDGAAAPLPLIVEDGNTITFEANLDRLPVVDKIKGSKPSQQMAKWVAENIQLLQADDPAKTNAAIARFVADNSKSLAASAILSTYFNCAGGYELLADSLYQLLDAKVCNFEVLQGFNTVVAAQLIPSARAPIPILKLYERCDSIVIINHARYSATMLCFVPDGRAARDSVARRLRVLTDTFSRRQLMPVEISSAIDSASWRLSIDADSAPKWYQTWAIGSVAAPNLRGLAIPRLPFFIVTDSIGAQLYRGTSLTEAEQTVRNIINKAGKQ